MRMSHHLKERIESLTGNLSFLPMHAKICMEAYPRDLQVVHRELGVLSTEGPCFRPHHNE